MFSIDRNDDGRYSNSRTDEEVLDAVAGNAPAATTEVADSLGLTRQAADYRLRQLREDGRVESKQIGSALAWSLPRDDSSRDPAREVNETPSPVSPEPATGEPDTEASALEDRIEYLDIPGSGTSLDQRVAATVRIVEHLEEVGVAHTKVRNTPLTTTRSGTRMSAVFGLTSFGEQRY